MLVPDAQTRGVLHVVRAVLQPLLAHAEHTPRPARDTEVGDLSILHHE